MKQKLQTKQTAEAKAIANFRQATNSRRPKTALVTGSTSGIGLAVAHALAAKGHNVVLNSRKMAAEIEPLRQVLEAEHGVDVAYQRADMAVPEQIENLFQNTAELFGGIDILVNNAGIQFVSPIDKFPTERWDAIIATNLTSAFHTIRLTLPYMRKQGWGRIVNIASAHSLVASPFKAAYTSAKHGLLGLTKTVALEVAEQNITCNAICPGYVMTPLVEKQIPDTAIARGISEEEVIRDVMLAPQATKKFVKVDEVSALVEFLCGDAAASMTGSALPMDGGWTAH
jgi:3-hydroxybutyrate dehydrogenase